MIEIYSETINLYFIFLGSFISSSFICFIQDIYCDYPYVQQNKNNKKEILKIYLYCLPLVLFNIFLTIPFSLIITQNFFVFLSPFSYYNIYHIPILFILIDPTFYTCHRLFHNKYLYKFHKIHHKIKRPVSISSLYLHPLDLIFGNILPLFLPVFIIKSSIPLLYFWTFFTIFQTTYMAHSGIKNRCEDHDLHHLLYNCNYGTGLYLFDRLFETYSSK
jgi:sterol desaturase/sphingolipid hydroxylase (fatty acid hydroxylase superfamily)